jgi:hypothetical protein
MRGLVRVECYSLYVLHYACKIHFVVTVNRNLAPVNSILCVFITAPPSPLSYIQLYSSVDRLSSHGYSWSLVGKAS